MVKLSDDDVQTKEVLDWKGLHLFHFSHSTCSQKLRIFLKLKGLDWTSHHLDLARKKHHTPWYMGVNPRGLVPTLVHDGQVIIESNDILAHLEAAFPDPPLIPDGGSQTTTDLLKAEDDLHHDIRALTFRFVLPNFLAGWREKQQQAYAALGSGTVGGAPDPEKERELAFWRDVAAKGGVSDERAQRAFQNFRAALSELDARLSVQSHILVERPTLIDIAWYIYARRLRQAGYPIAQMHPAVGRWFQRLDGDPTFHNEVPSGGAPALVSGALRAVQKMRGVSLQHLAPRWIAQPLQEADFTDATS